MDSTEERILAFERVEPAVRRRTLRPLLGPLPRYSVEVAIRQNREAEYVKPNEDFVVADRNTGIFIVCDGITRSFAGAYPQPSPAAEISRLVGEALHRSLVDALRKTYHGVDTHALRSAFIDANREAAAYNDKYFAESDYIERDRAGSVALAVVIKGERCLYSYCGDCALYLIRAGFLRRLTVNQTQGALAHINTNLPGLAGTIEMRRTMRNNRRHPLGFGALTGEPGLSDFVMSGDFEIKPSDRILAVSDGLEPLLDGGTWPMHVGAEELIDLAETIEASRGLRSDDKAVIDLRF